MSVSLAPASLYGGPDLVRDFAYAKVTTAIPAGASNDTLVVPIDSNSRLPANSELAVYSFWMTVESDLPTGAFEVVRLLSTSANAATVLRGQDGTTPTSHPSGVYLKGSITAAMWRRANTYRRYVDLGNVASHGVSSNTVAANQPNVLRTLVGSIRGVAVTTGGIVVRYALVSTSRGVATVSATTVSPNVTHTLNGIAVGKATATGSLTIKASFRGTAAGQATVAGVLTVPSTTASKTYAGRTYANGTY